MIETLFALGPGLIRAVGSLFGGKTKDVADTVAGIADSVKGLPGDVARREFASKVETLPPEAAIELRKLAIEAERIRAEQAQAELMAETDRYAESQRTIRTELELGDDFVKRTRPLVARRSFAVGTGYVLVTELARLVATFFPVGTGTGGADPAIAGILFGPCVWYFTMRTADAFSQKGKS